jgi:hypothetical protein
MSEEIEKPVNKPTKKKVVSFSQYQKWYKCPNQWKLDYIDNLKKFEHNLTLTFGNAIHEAIQKYVETLYTKGMLKATTLNVKEIFLNYMAEEIHKYNIPYTEEELNEFMLDGYHLLTEFMTAAIRLKHFPPDKYEFLGIEDELNMPLEHNVEYWGYIDLVLKEKATGRIKIFDFKTARMGWNNYQREDDAKTSQLVLYKSLYAKKHNIPLSMIDVEFFILKRKLYEESAFRQSRIQIFNPDAHSGDCNRVMNHFSQFIKECFTPEGKYNENGTYPKVPGKNKTNCKYCSHKGVTCDAVAEGTKARKKKVAVP